MKKNSIVELAKDLFVKPNETGGRKRKKHCKELQIVDG
jgi:hypothetical protein